MNDVATAVWFPGPREVELRQEDVPNPGPGEVRVQAIASGVSAGTEMLVYRGEAPGDLPLDLPTLRGSYTFPIKFGYASVGTVTEAGPGVDRRRVGEAVFTHHPHQSEYVIPAGSAVPLPREIDPELGVFLANLETGVNVLLDAAPRLGERVLIFGQGVVGLILTQLFKRAGASALATVEPAARRSELSRAVGADAVLQPRDDLGRLVDEMTGGTGFDVVVESSGNPAALPPAIEAAAFQGSIVVCSWYGTKPACLPLGGAFHRRRLRLVSSQVGAVDPGLAPRWTRERRMELARSLLPRLELSPLISHRFPLARAGDVYGLLDSTPQDVVQVVLTYGDRNV